MKNYTTVWIAFCFLSSTLMGGEAFDRQAHRGGRGIMPENTLAAMKYALGLGCTLEMDLSYTKDKKVIVSHDNYMSSLFVTDPNGNPVTKQDANHYWLYNMTYDEISKFDVGLRPYPEFPQQKKMPATIPLFEDMLKQIEAYAKQQNCSLPRYNIEAKLAVPVNKDTDAFREEFIKAIMLIIEKHNIHDRAMIQSFDVGMLWILHRDYPEATISYLVGKNVDFEANLNTLGFTPHIFSPIYTAVTKDMVNQCHKMGIKIIPWTANTKEEIAALKAMGVDGVITDYPNFF